MMSTLEKSGFELETNTAYYSYTFPKQIIENVEDMHHSSHTMTFLRSHQSYIFHKLAGKIIDDFYFTSSPSRICRNENYIKIIEMGTSAIPLLIEQLEYNPTYWFPALFAITKDNPVDDKNKGILVNMVNDWKNWAIGNGYSDK